MSTRRKQAYKRWVPSSDRPTDRELQVLGHISNGLSNKEIGAALYLAEDTVKTHVSRLLRRIGARERSHAVSIGFTRGWLVVGEPPSEPAELLDIELRLIGLVEQGLTYGRIARQLDLDGEESVKHRMRVLCRELRARNRAHAVRRGYEHRLLPRGARG